MRQQSVQRRGKEGGKRGKKQDAGEKQKRREMRVETNVEKDGEEKKAWESKEKETGAEEKSVQRVRPWETGWSARSPGRGDHTHTDTHTCVQLPVHVDGHTRIYSTHNSALHQAVYLLMRLFKNAVGGRALNHPSASLKENCGVRCMEGKEGGRESLSVKQC